jgi:uncharacterized protein YjdB
MRVAKEIFKYFIYALVVGAVVGGGVYFARQIGGDKDAGGPRVVEVTGIAITGGVETVLVTGSIKFGVVITPANATNKTVTWSVVSGAATNGGNGNFMFFESGIVTIRASAANGVYDEKQVTVTEPPIVPTPVTAVDITGGASITTVGDTLQFGASITPRNATNKTIVWSVATGIATNNGNGNFTFTVAGVVTIRATASNDIFAEANVTVTEPAPPAPPVAVEHIEIFGDDTATVGDTVQLGATVTPQNASDKTIAWSVATGTAINNGNGNFTFTTAGTVTIRATADGVSAEIQIAVSPISHNIYIGAFENGTITADKAMAPTGETITLTITPAPNYHLAVLYFGSTEIPAGENLTATFTMPNRAVTISAVFARTIVAVTAVTIAPSPAEFTIGASHTFSATVAPSNATNQTLAWSVVSGTATNLGNGRFTFTTIGTVTICAIAQNGVYDERQVTVRPVIYAVTIGTFENGVVTADKYTAAAGDTVNLTISPKISYHTETLSINGAPHPFVGALAAFTMPAGAVTITATFAPDIIAVQSVQIVGNPARVLTGDTFAFSATVFPNNATDKSLVWQVSGDGSAGQISSNGNFTAPIQRFGNPVIRVSSVQNPSVFAEYAVTVVQSFTIPTFTDTFGTATATITPQPAKFAIGDTVTATIATTKNYYVLKSGTLALKRNGNTIASNISSSGTAVSFVVPAGAVYGDTFAFDALFYTKIPYSATNATFTANSQKTAPTNFITDQRNFETWTYDGESMRGNGCGIIGVWNAFFAVGIYLDMAELILYYECTTDGTMKTYLAAQGVPIYLFDISVGTLPKHVVTFTNYLVSSYGDFGGHLSATAVTASEANNISGNQSIVATKFNSNPPINSTFSAHTYALNKVGGNLRAYNCTYSNTYTSPATVQNTWTDTDGAAWQSSMTIVIFTVNLGDGIFKISLN